MLSWLHGKKFMEFVNLNAKREKYGDWCILDWVLFQMIPRDQFWNCLTVLWLRSLRKRSLSINYPFYLILVISAVGISVPSIFCILNFFKSTVLFCLLLSKGRRNCQLQNDQLTFQRINRVWNAIVDAKELCSVLNHKASISKRVSAFSFISIRYLFIDLSSSTIEKFA